MEDSSRGAIRLIDDGANRPYVPLSPVVVGDYNPESDQSFAREVVAHLVAYTIVRRKADLALTDWEEFETMEVPVAILDGDCIDTDMDLFKVHTQLDHFILGSQVILSKHV